MKKLLILVPFLAVGCSSQPTATSVPMGGGESPLAKKLAAMPVGERANYVRTHAAQVAASAGMQAPEKH